MKRYARAVIALVCLGFLSACAVPDPREKPVEGNLFKITLISFNTIAGRFDPNFFSTEEIQRASAILCRGGKISELQETTVDNQTAFLAECMYGTPYFKASGGGWRTKERQIYYQFVVSRLRDVTHQGETYFIDGTVEASN